MVHRSLPNPIHAVVSPGSLRARLWADPLRLQLGKSFFGLLLHLDGWELEMGWLASVRISGRSSLGLFTAAISKVHHLEDIRGGLQHRLLEGHVRLALRLRGLSDDLQLLQLAGVLFADDV